MKQFMNTNEQLRELQSIRPVNSLSSGEMYFFRRYESKSTDDGDNSIKICPPITITGVNCRQIVLSQGLEDYYCFKAVGDYSKFALSQKDENGESVQLEKINVYPISNICPDYNCSSVIVNSNGDLNYYILINDSLFKKPASNQLVLKDLGKDYIYYLGIVMPQVKTEIEDTSDSGEVDMTTYQEGFILVQIDNEKELKSFDKNIEE